MALLQNFGNFWNTYALPTPFLEIKKYKLMGQLNWINYSHWNPVYFFVGIHGNGIHCWTGFFIIFPCLWWQLKTNTQFIQGAPNLIEILKSTQKGKGIVLSYIERNEDFVTHKERIEIVNIVCNHMIECNPQKHFPSVNTKHMYAAAIIKSFLCLATKLTDQDGGVSLNHDVFYHPVAGGFIENRIK